MIPHTSNARPVPPKAPVIVDVGDGRRYLGRADEFHWGEGDNEADGAGRILRYLTLGPLPRPEWSDCGTAR